MGGELLLAVVAALLVAGGLLWRARSLRGRRVAVAVALVDRDPTVRATGLQTIAAVGLRSWAPFLLERTVALDGTDDEQSSLMRAELAWLVGACQWESADTVTIVQLRLWAQAHHARVPDSAPMSATTTVGEPVAVRDGASLRAAAEVALGERVLDARFEPTA